LRDVHAAYTYYVVASGILLIRHGMLWLLMIGIDVSIIVVVDDG